MRYSARYLFFISLFLFLPLFSHAQVFAEQSYDAPNNSAINPYIDPSTNPDVPKNLHTWTQSIVLNIFSSLTCQITGYDTLDLQHECLGLDPKSGKIGYVQGGGGAIGLMGNLIAMTYTSPLHMSDYTDYLAGNFGIAKKTYAAGQSGPGYSGLSPLLGMWISFRNLSYLFFIIVFILIGFTVMLRIKIDPRTVMGIQNQIPKVIIGLLLVTFSFAIAAFLIDLMWVFTYLIISILYQAAPDSIPLDKVYANLLQNPIGFVNEAVQGGILSVSKNASETVQGIVSSMFSGGGAGGTSATPPPDCGFFNVACKLNTGVTSVISSALGYLLSFIVGALAFFVIAIALFIAMFRLWFALISAYVFILIDVIFAPFMIIAGIIPGSKMSFSAWLRDITANLSVFPVTVGMLMLANIFMHIFGQQNPSDQSTHPSNYFIPPLIGSPSVVANIGAIIAVGMIFLTPQIVTMMKGLLKAPSFKFTGDIMKGIGAGVKPITGGAGKVWHVLSRPGSPYNPAGPLRTAAIQKLGGNEIKGKAPSKRAWLNQWRYRIVNTMLGEQGRGEGHP